MTQIHSHDAPPQGAASDRAAGKDAKEKRPRGDAAATLAPKPTAPREEGEAAPMPEDANATTYPATALAELVMRPWLEAQQHMLRLWGGMSGPLTSPASLGAAGPFLGLGVGLAGAPNPMRLLALPLQRQPESDLAECRDCYELSLELPGVDPEELEVRCGPGVIMVIGEKREEAETQRMGLTIAERRFGRFERTFALPADADTNAAEAHYHDGVLVVRAPKAHVDRDGMTRIPIGHH